MFTPQEIQERAENLEKAVFGGYSMSSVEDLLGALRKDYAELYKENAVLKSKIKVLAERMEKYRKQEERLNRAILTAQKTSDDLVAEAERRCAKMTMEAEQRLRQRNEDLQREIAEETEKVNRAKADLQLEIAAERDKATQERAALQKKIAAEGERVVMAKKAAAAFIMELEERVQQQLSQLEHIKQLDLTVSDEDETEAGPAEQSETTEDKNPAQSEEKPEEPSLPKELSESEMSRQIEASISRILAESMKQEEPKNKSMDDTRIVSPV